MQQVQGWGALSTAVGAGAARSCHQQSNFTTVPPPTPTPTPTAYYTARHQPLPASEHHCRDIEAELGAGDVEFAARVLQGAFHEAEASLHAARRFPLVGAALVGKFGSACRRGSAMGGVRGGRAVVIVSISNKSTCEQSNSCRGKLVICRPDVLLLQLPHLA